MVCVLGYCELMQHEQSLRYVPEEAGICDVVVDRPVVEAREVAAMSVSYSLV